MCVHRYTFKKAKSLSKKTINTSSGQNSTLWFDLLCTCNIHQRSALIHVIFLLIHEFHLGLHLQEASYYSMI